MGKRDREWMNTNVNLSINLSILIWCIQNIWWHWNDIGHWPMISIETGVFLTHASMNEQRQSKQWTITIENRQNVSAEFWLQINEQKITITLYLMCYLIRYDPVAHKLTTLNQMDYNTYIITHHFTNELFSHKWSAKQFAKTVSNPIRLDWIHKHTNTHWKWMRKLASKWEILSLFSIYSFCQRSHHYIRRKIHLSFHCGREQKVKTMGGKNIFESE